MPHSIGDGRGHTMIVGATHLPPDFFQNNPKIIILGSHGNRH
jgi:hypothetical protein